MVVEALSKVLKRTLDESANTDLVEFCIYRPIGIPRRKMTALKVKAESYVGSRYGYLKLVTALWDWVLFEIYFFRGLNFIRSRPFCSYLVGYAYSSIGLHFGVAEKGVTPDDIWDYVTVHKDKYVCIKKLGGWNKGWVPSPLTKKRKKAKALAAKKELEEDF